MNDRAGPTRMEPPRGKMSDLDVEAFLRDPARKQEFVTPMFDTIAPKYDRFTRLFSFGMDAGWKRLAIRLAVDAAHERGDVRRALDLASGTGDLAIGIVHALPDVHVTAVDASREMVHALATRLGGIGSELSTRIEPVVGDMTNLDVDDSSIELVTAAYGIRNVPEVRRAISEIARVMKPGGVLVTLDFYRPRKSLWRRLLLWYLSVAGNAVGWLWYRDPIIYGYIARSIAHFVDSDEFSAMLREAGFTIKREQRFLGGGIAVHLAIRS